MLLLRCTTQNYDWGVPASQDSKVLVLARANGVEAAADKTGSSDTRFSELWVGTHPSGEAAILAKSGQSGPTLGEWLGRHPEALGAKLASWQQQQGQGPLPFLMKVLSIDRALPLQAHPTSSTAKKLHQKDPETYPDEAHKPEMVVALNSFAGFAGFLAFDKMAQLLGRMPQLAAVLGDANVQAYLAAGPGDTLARQQALAAMWQQLLLHTPPDLAAQTLQEVMKKLEAQQQGSGAALLPAGTHSAAAVGAWGGSSSAGNDGAGPSQPNAKVPTTGTSSAATIAEAQALAGPEPPHLRSSDISLALGVVSEPGGLSTRDAKLKAAAAAWPGEATGVLALLLLEDVVLGPGEAALIPSGCPHAYISGEVLEIQAASNNTIKGGLTGDPTDRQALVDIVTAGLASSSPDALISDNVAAPTTAPAEAPASAADTPTATATDPTAPTAAAAAAGPGDAGCGDRTAVWEGPPPPVNPIMPGAALPSGGVDGLLLYQPGLGVGEFQAWHVTAQPGQKAIDMVMDPGPGVLLVVGGSGHVSVKAGVVVDDNIVDEAELHPGTAMFIPAGTSLSFTGSSSTAALDAWITTGNSRMFTSAAPAPAGEAKAAAAAAGDGAKIKTGDAAGKTGAGSGGVVQGSSEGLEPGVGFTAAEQVAAAVMAGAAGSSCPVNAQDASAAAGQTAMETD